MNFAVSVCIYISQRNAFWYLEIFIINQDSDGERFVPMSFFFLAFDFCRFCVVIWFFHPRDNGQWPPTSKDFLYQILSITFISQYFPFECSVLNKETTYQSVFALRVLVHYPQVPFVFLRCNLFCFYNLFKF